MTMLKKININSTVKVKLNEYGIQKLKKEYAYKTIDDGVVKLQMWELFYIFGSDYTIGNTKLPFGTTMYIYIKKMLNHLIKTTDKLN